MAPNGRTYVRYLPTGVAVGTTAKYLTVGTYAFYERVRRNQGGGSRKELDHRRGT